MRVGERNNNTHMGDNLEGLIRVLERDIEEYGSSIRQTIVDCALGMPERLTVYTTLVGLLNVQNFEFAGQIIDSVVLELQSALNKGNWRMAKLAVRFLVDSVNTNVVLPASIISLYDSLISPLTDTTRVSYQESRCDACAELVLASLPWIGRELYKVKPDDVERILGVIERHLSARSVDMYVPAIQVWRDGFEVEAMAALWQSIKQLRDDLCWEERVIPRPYVAMESRLSEAMQHTLGTIHIPQHTRETVYPEKRVIFRLFDASDITIEPPLPLSLSIERYILEETVRDMLSLYEPDRKAAIKHLLSMPGSSRFPIEYIIVEVTLGELLKLPCAEYLPMYYMSVLVELCRSQHSEIPVILPLAIDLIFDRLDSMDVECVDRFCQWFALHLSNFDFKWIWSEWETALREDEKKHKDSMRITFVTELLVRLTRLSYYERIVRCIPPEFERYMPVKPGPNWRYELRLQEAGAGRPPRVASSQRQGTFIAQIVFNAIRRKADVDELRVLLDDRFRTDDNAATPVNDDDEIANMSADDEADCALLVGGDKSEPQSLIVVEDIHRRMTEREEKRREHGMRECASSLGLTAEQAAKLRRSVLLQTILQAGSKSTSHLIAVTDRYLPLLQSIVAERGIESLDFVESIAGFWWDHVQNIVIVIDRFYAIGLLSAPTIVAWLFSEEMQSQFSSFYVWEILHDTLRRAIRTVDIASMDEDDERTAEAENVLQHAFILMFQGFSRVLSAHLAIADADGSEVRSHWYVCTTGNLLSVGRRYAKEIRYYSTHLDPIFGPSVDSRIRDIVTQFKAITAA